MDDDMQTNVKWKEKFVIILYNTDIYFSKTVI